MRRLVTPAAVAGDGAVLAAARLARELLRPQAEQVDRTAVPAGHVQAIAAAGLLGVTASVEFGGGGAGPAVGREVAELLAAACGATWLVTAQHATPLRLATAAARSGRDYDPRPLATGERRAGIAVSQLRRPGAPPVRATRRSGGWEITGRVDWLTGWGLIDVVLVGARTDEEVLLALVEADDPGITASAPLPLAAMAGSRTVAADLTLTVPDRAVLDIQPVAAWRGADRLTTADATPATFGLLRAVIAELDRRAADRDDPLASRAAGVVDRQAAALRDRCYTLRDALPADQGLAERLALRAASLELAVRSAAALVSAGAGAALALHQPAQRLAREALFHLVQAQTPAVRAASVERLLGPLGGGLPDPSPG